MGIGPIPSPLFQCGDGIGVVKVMGQRSGVEFLEPVALHPQAGIIPVFQ